ncbi:TPA: DUF3310 domain-containing protein [Campylobacter jejuni]|nr:DUF3310 domain-containing protein [Campylobacter jejuni]
MKEKEFSVDLVNNPPHYKGFGFENLDFLEEIFNIMPEKRIVFHIGNALKYAIRSKFKGYEIQDLEKCEFYVKRCERFISMERPVECYKGIVIYLNLISQKDFKLYILINDICSFALNPSQRNYNALINSLKKYIRERKNANETKFI